MTGSWQPDILAGHEAMDLDLTGVSPAPEEPEGPLRAVLVRHAASVPGRRVAVLYVHGWNDYYFQAGLAENLHDAGYAFYALDLRRYGRAWDTGLLAGWIDDLGDYSLELALACEQIARDHDAVILMGHSTGGLTVSLWADRWQRSDLQLAGVVLNSPWLDLQGSFLAVAAAQVITQLGARRSTQVLPLPASDVYARALADWDYNRDWKQVSAPVRVGWLSAIIRGHQRVRKGLDIDCPVLVGCATKSLLSTQWSDEMTAADTVLDVRQIARQATNLGGLVTVVRVPGGLHDLTLSRPAARRHWYDEMGRWMAAYAPAEAV